MLSLGGFLPLPYTGLATGSGVVNFAEPGDAIEHLVSGVGSPERTASADPLQHVPRVFAIHGDLGLEGLQGGEFPLAAQLLQAERAGAHGLFGTRGSSC